MFKTTFIRTISIAFLCVLAASQVHADTGESRFLQKHRSGPSFNEQSLKGSWGFVDDGLAVTEPGAQPLAFASVGVFYFDGLGSCGGFDIANLQGATIGPRSFGGEHSECTYEVNDNGFGFMNISIDGEIVVVRFIIVKHGREFKYIVEGGIVASGVATRQ